MASTVIAATAIAGAGVATESPGLADADVRLFRLRLEQAWTAKMDEIIALSQACQEAAPSAGGTRHQLTIRTERAYHQLAAVEDALRRIEEGRFGSCDSCHQPMPADWVSQEPQVSRCPDCALDSVRWQHRVTVHSG